MPPQLSQVLMKLRESEPALRKLGVLHAAVFGSVARGEQNADSDIDILIDLDPAKSLGLFEYARLQLDMAELFSQPIDVANRKTLKPLLKDSILSEAVNAF